MTSKGIVKAFQTPLKRPFGEFKSPPNLCLLQNMFTLKNFEVIDNPFQKHLKTIVSENGREDVRGGEGKPLKP